MTHQGFQCHYNGRVCDGDTGEMRSGMVRSQNAAAETGAGHMGQGREGVNEMGFFVCSVCFSLPFLIFNFLILIFFINF